MSEGTLYTALLAAQKAMGPVKKDASNPAFRTKYATLQSVLETIDGPLNDNGLVLLQRFDVGEGVPVLITEIVHAASGDRIASAVPVVSKDPTDPQKMGGAITYYRRYSLLALLGLAPEDDDGHAASQPSRPSRQEPEQGARYAAAATATRAVLDGSAPAKGEPPAFVSNKLFTATDFRKLVDLLWQLAEDGAALARIKDELNGSRHRMTWEMMDEARLALAKIEAQFYAPAGIAG